MNEYIKQIRQKVGHDRIILVGAGVIIHSGGRLLLQRRRDNGCWALHGGCVEIGEAVEDAARRELYEETGLTAGKLEMLDVFSGEDMLYTYPNGDKVYVVSVIYTCEDFTGEPIVETDETLTLRWFDAGSLPEDLSTMDAQALNIVSARLAANKKTAL